MRKFMNTTLLLSGIWAIIASVVVAYFFLLVYGVFADEKSRFRRWCCRRTHGRLSMGNWRRGQCWCGLGYSDLSVSNDLH